MQHQATQDVITLLRAWSAGDGTGWLLPVLLGGLRRTNRPYLRRERVHSLPEQRRKCAAPSWTAEKAPAALYVSMQIVLREWSVAEARGSGARSPARYE